MKLRIERYGSVKQLPANVVSEIEKWPKHCSQDYEVLKACDSLLRLPTLKCRINCFLIYDKDTVAAMMPVRILRNGSLHIAGEFSRMDYVDFLYNPKYSKQSKKIIEFFLAEMKSKYGVKKFYGKYVPSNSPTAKMKYDDKEDVNYVAVNLMDKNYDDFFARLSKHSKQNLRTAYNRLSRDGKTYEFVVYDGPKESYQKQAKKDSDECLSLYMRRQESQYKHHEKTYRIKTKFEHYLTKSLKTDKNAVLAVLKIDGKIAAFFEGFMNTSYKSVEIPRLAINDEMKFYSPGMLLCNEAIKYYFGKIEKFDLGRGTEGYKIAMGGEIYTANNFSKTL